MAAALRVFQRLSVEVSRFLEAFGPFLCALELLFEAAALLKLSISLSRGVASVGDFCCPGVSTCASTGVATPVWTGDSSRNRGWCWPTKSRGACAGPWCRFTEPVFFLAYLGLMR